MSASGRQTASFSQPGTNAKGLLHPSPAQPRMLSHNPITLNLAFSRKRDSRTCSKIQGVWPGGTSPDPSEAMQGGRIGSSLRLLSQCYIHSKPHIFHMLCLLWHTHICHSITRVGKAGQSEVQGCPWVHRELGTRLIHESCLKSQTSKGCGDGSAGKGTCLQG